MLGARSRTTSIIQPSRWMMLSVVLALWIVPSELFAQQTGDQHWRDRDILGAVVLVSAIQSEDDQWHSWGTGVFIDVDTAFLDIFFVTNRHIWKARDSLKLTYKIYRQEESIHTVTSMEQIVNTNEYLLCPATEDSDYVAVVLQRNAFRELRPIRPETIIPFGELNYGEDVRFYGYPLYDQYGLHASSFSLPVVRAGVVAYFALADVYYAKRKVMLPKMFLVDGVSFGGGSGSPVFVRRPYINSANLIVYDTRFAGIVRGHYSVSKEVTIPLSKIPLISQKIDSFHVNSDSLYLSRMLKDFRYSHIENSDLAFVISSDLLVEFIRIQYPLWVQNLISKN